MRVALALLLASCTVSTAPECAHDADCDDRAFCNGAEVCREGECVAGVPPCEADGIDCSDEVCDEAAGACRSVLHGERCDDGDVCNGLERCDRDLGCVRQSALSCDDGEACTDDACDPIDGCTHTPRDTDGDGEGDIACGGLDCLDDPELGPLARPGLTEACDDGVDNDCDGFIDAASSACPPSADRCSQRTTVSAPGTYYVGLRGLGRDHDVGCFSGYADAVLGLSLDAPSDVSLRARPFLLGVGPGSGLALRRAEDCAFGPDVVPRRCATDFAEGVTELAARALAPGQYAIVVNAQPDTVIALEVGIDPAVAPPAGTTCASAIDAESGVHAIDTSALGDSHLLACDERATLGDATYRVVLTEASDLRAVLRPAGTIALLRDCGPEEAALACAVFDGAGTTLSRSSLPTGTYYLAIEPAPYDLEGRPVRTAELELAISSATSTDGCAAPPALTLGTPQTVTVTGASRDVGTGCLSEPHADMAFALALDAPSDVAFSVRAVGADATVHAAIMGECGARDTLERCTYGFGEIETVARDLGPGTYTLVAGFDSTVTEIEVLATARPAAAIPAGDRCDDAPSVALGSSELLAMASAADDGAAVSCGVAGPEVYRRFTVDSTSMVRVGASADRGRVGIEILHRCDRGTVVDACSTVSPSVSIDHVLDPGEYVIAIEAQEEDASVTLTTEVVP